MSERAGVVVMKSRIRVSNEIGEGVDGVAIAIVFTCYIIPYGS